MFAVFPLSLAVLPGEKVALHLFEPRYKQLFQDHRSGESFVILHKDSKGEAKIGTLVYIDKIISVLDDGIADIVIKGTELIRIEKNFPHFPAKQYAAVDGVTYPAPSLLFTETINLAKAYFNGLDKHVDWSKIKTVYDLVSLMNRDEHFKLKLISCSNSSEQNRLVANEIKLLDKIHEQETILQNQFFLN